MSEESKLHIKPILHFLIKEKCQLSYLQITHWIKCSHQNGILNRHCLKKKIDKLVYNCWIYDGWSIS